MGCIVHVHYAYAQALSLSGNFILCYLLFHVFVRPCGHSSFRTNETRHMAEIHEVKHTAEIPTRNKAHSRDATYNKAVTRQDLKKTGTQICGK